MLLATLAAATSLIRAPVGRIVAADGGERLMLALLDECARIAEAEGHRPSDRQRLDPRRDRADASRARRSPPRCCATCTAGGPTEADHVIGDLIRRGAAHGVETPMLDVAWTNLQVYEAGRQRA